MNKVLYLELHKYFETNIPLIFIEGYESEIEHTISSLLNDTYEDFSKFNFKEFKVSKGLKRHVKKENIKMLKEMDMSSYDELIEELSEIARNIEYGYSSNIFILIHGIEDYLNGKESNKIKDILSIIVNITESRKDCNVTIMFSGNGYEIPNTLRDHSMLISRTLPQFIERVKIIKDFIQFHIPVGIGKEIEFNDLARKLRGFSRIEIIQVLSFLYYENGITVFHEKLDFQNPEDKSLIAKIDLEIRKVKVQKLTKLGTLKLEKYDLKKNKLSEIKGQEGLFEYISSKKEVIANIDLLEKNGITLPKGILLLGPPGTGKSMTAKGIANELNLDLIKFEISEILGKYVGESEKRMQETLDVVQFMSPCVLWIDEIEKAFAGVNKDNNEVMRKVFGLLLTWMSDKNKGVFVVATANNVEGILPPEFLRKGRFDEIFYIDLPDKETRKQIIDVHFGNRNINVNEILTGNDVGKFVFETWNFSGAEIEYCCNEASIAYFLCSSNENNNKTDALLNEFNKVIKTIKKTKDNEDETSLSNSTLKVLNQFSQKEIAKLENELLMRKNRGEFNNTIANGVIEAFRSKIYKDIKTNLEKKKKIDQRKIIEMQK
ncbi:AAA family ATPase [Staphylococcus equorum]